MRQTNLKWAKCRSSIDKKHTCRMYRLTVSSYALRRHPPPLCDLLGNLRLLKRSRKAYVGAVFYSVRRGRRIRFRGAKRGSLFTTSMW